MREADPSGRPSPSTRRRPIQSATAIFVLLVRAVAAGLASVAPAAAARCSPAQGRWFNPLAVRLMFIALFAIVGWVVLGASTTTAAAAEHGYDVVSSSRIERSGHEWTNGLSDRIQPGRTPDVNPRPGGPAQGPAARFATEEGSAVGDLAGACHSFDKHTEVLMADGTRKQIGDVKIGDRVRTTDPKTGETLIRPVTELHVNRDTDLADVTVRGADGNTSTIHTTQHHRFWDETRNTWVDAGDLKAGERLHDLDGSTVTVAGVVTFGGLQTMYDLTIDGVHTYYVEAGEQPVLVHNCNLPKNARGLEDVVDSTARDALRARGGGAGNTSVLRSDMADWTVREIAEAAASKDPDAVAWLKMIKQADSQGKGGK